MAGDWIKMRADLFTHPKVVRMASALKADKLRTVGGLMSVWCLFDAHSVDGKLDGYTFEEVDDHLRWPGFSGAMCAIGWIAKTENCLVLPEFDTHNGHSAKRRAQDADRKRDVRKTSALDADKKRTREEKRREEKSNTSTATTTLKGVAAEETETEGFTPTQAGAICKAIRQCGLADVNPGHPRLRALIEAGATEPEFTGFARSAVKDGKGFLWLLGAVEGERKRAALIGSQIHRGPLHPPVSRQAALEARNASIVEQLKREHAA